MSQILLYEVKSNALETVARAFNRTEESLKQDVATLKQWMLNQPHLPEILEDNVLQNFLIMNKCSIERAKSKIDNYYTLRSRIPNVFQIINIQTFKDVMKAIQWVSSPKMTEDMSRLSLCRTRSKELLEKINPFDIIKCMCIIREIRMREDIMSGDIIIFDMKVMTIRQASKFTPAFFKTLLTIYEKIYATQMKEVYLVNSSSVITTFLTIAKSLMKPKLFERIHVCENTSILTKRLPRELLPRDYGGDEISMDEIEEMMIPKLSQFEDCFDKLEKLRVNEKLRPERLENDENLGFYGNFKQLSFD